MTAANMSGTPSLSVNVDPNGQYVSANGQTPAGTTTSAGYVPVAPVDPATGATLNKPTINADGSMVIAGFNGSNRASGPNPLPTRDTGFTTLAHGQISVGTTATVIAAARSGRGPITIVNGGTTDVFIGNSNVTTTTGVLLPGTKGASITLSCQTAVYGIVGTGTQTVSFIEAYS